jgi:putative pyruvate formate lyase activating enzyme
VNTINQNDPISRCSLCPRECKINRHEKQGFCGETDKVRIARADLHMWEEPYISGECGSGAVFFSGCNLKCCFCQNYEISHLGKGFELTAEELADAFLRLQKLGAHNINLVNPTHFVPQIIEALDIAGERLEIPVVYNSGGYEKTETLELLRGKVQIFLPDLKYYDSAISQKYSGAADYFERAIAAIRKMTDIVGTPKIENGIMKSGVIVRHMILPGCRRDSIKLIGELQKRFDKNEIIISLMSQYTPVYKAENFKEINRRLSTFEYRTVAEVLNESGFDGFVQEKASASEDFIPTFYSRKYF